MFNGIKNNLMRNKALLEIAQKVLSVDTLKDQNNSNDFKEYAIWNIREALEQAYEAGVRSVTTDSRFDVKLSLE